MRTVRPTGMGEGELRKALTWRYPWARDVEIPSKLTATQLKGRELDREAAEHTPQAGTRRGEGVLRRPRFAEEEFGLTPAQKGVALHLVMQYIDFSKASSEAQVAREVERLVREEYLTPEQGKAVDPARLAAFFASPLGREACASPTLRREFKFSILVPARDYWPEAGEGKRSCSRAWWTASLRQRRGSPWWTSRPTGWREKPCAGGRRSTAPSWRRTAGPWRRSPAARSAAGCCGSFRRTGAWRCCEPAGKTAAER